MAAAGLTAAAAAPRLVATSPLIVAKHSYVTVSALLPIFLDDGVARCHGAPPMAVDLATAAITARVMVRADFAPASI